MTPHRASILLIVVASMCSSAEYAEEVLFRPLGNISPVSDPGIARHFQFTARLSVPTDDGDAGTNEALAFPSDFPRSVSRIVSDLGIEEFALTFSRGQWVDSWGPQIRNQVFPTGMSLFGSFFRRRGADPEARWTILKESLSALFCASVNGINDANTVKEDVSEDFVERAFLSTLSTTETREPVSYRYAHLPHEAVCTENLRPWLHLLPCRDVSGIASWIDPVEVFSGPFYSMSIRARWVYDESSKHLEFVQTLTAVSTSSAWSADTVPEACAASRVSSVLVEGNLDASKSERAASLKEYGSATLVEMIPSPSQSWVVGNDRKTLQAYGDDPPGWLRHRLHMNRLDMRSIDPDMRALGFRVAYSISSDTDRESEPSFSIRRFDYGQFSSRRGLQTQLRNEHRTITQRALYREYLPWFVRRKYSTFRISIGKTMLNESEIWGGEHGIDSGIVRIVVPSRDGDRSPSQLSVSLDVPPQTTVTINFEFEAAFLHFEDFAPDSNRGFDLPSGFVSLIVPDDARANEDDVCSSIVSPLLRDATTTLWPNAILFTNPVAIMLPVLDFSMPFNVITLSCTALAFLFGSVLGAVTRRRKENE
eukprot:g669.t1